MSTEPTADDGSTKAETTEEPAIDPEASHKDDAYRWYVSPEGSKFTVGKVSYSEFELRFGPMGVTFDSVKWTDDGEYELRDGHDTQGTFDPDDDEVPSEVAVAFKVLANEL